MAKPEDKTILVVDDEPDLREHLSMVLEDAGFNVVTAGDGGEALEKIKEKRPDFISLDLVMPGKSGIKFLYELRHNKEWSDIPFLIVTAHARDDLGKKDLKNILANKTFSGPGVYLEKPIVPDQYVAIICRELGVEYKGGEDRGSPEIIKEELERLIEGADAESLEEMLKFLKKKK